MVSRTETARSGNWSVLITLASPILTLMFIMMAIPVGIWLLLESMRKGIGHMNKQATVANPFQG